MPGAIDLPSYFRRDKLAFLGSSFARSSDIARGIVRLDKWYWRNPRYGEFISRSNWSLEQLSPPYGAFVVGAIIAGAFIVGAQLSPEHLS